MKSMLCNIWDDFCLWVYGWGDVTFAIVMGVLGVLALLGLLTFFKGNFDKGKKIKWLKLIGALLLFGLLALLAVARFNR